VIGITIVRIRYHELVGKRVIDAEDASLGHVVDLVADACDERLVVHTLLIGPNGFLARIGLHRIGMLNFRPEEIPWSAVGRISEAITLRPEWNRRRQKERL
jgi:sporulation protein YlmC with PRC-barrel domain